MNFLLKQVLERESFQDQVNQWCKKNKVQRPRLLYYSIEKVKTIYINFVDKQGYKNNFLKQKIISENYNWLYKQLALFDWCVVSLGIVYSINIDQFDQNMNKLISQIFCQKQIYVIQYQLKTMIFQGNQSRSIWSKQQQNFLTEIIEKNKLNNWNEIARLLFKQSNRKYFRQGKHCRQRYYRYVKGSVLHQWNQQNDYKLIQLVKNKRKKWKQIINFFNNSSNQIFFKKRYKRLIKCIKSKNIDIKNQKQAINIFLSKNYDIKFIKKKNQKINYIKKLRKNRIQIINLSKNQQLMQQCLNKSKQYDNQNLKNFSRNNMQNNCFQIQASNFSTQVQEKNQYESYDGSQLSHIPFSIYKYQQNMNINIFYQFFNFTVLNSNFQNIFLCSYQKNQLNLINSNLEMSPIYFFY